MNNYSPYSEGLHKLLEKIINETIPLFGYELIRDHLLPSVLGVHEGEILYWAGKEIARKFPLFSTEEIPAFFAEAGWGNLSLIKLSKKEAFYELTNDTIDLKVDQRKFQLEAGFIAEQYQKLNNVLTECHADIKKRNQSIHFQVKWDPKTIIDKKDAAQ